MKRIIPEAKFILHLTQWWNPDYCAAFYKTMIMYGVKLDFIGLSYFPSSGLYSSNTFNDLNSMIDKLTSEIKIPVIICEYGYPSKEHFTGQFSDWNRPVIGYPLDEAGQANWLIDFTKFCAINKSIIGCFYWSPEWYNEDMWKAFSLFDENGRAKVSLLNLKNLLFTNSK